MSSRPPHTALGGEKTGHLTAINADSWPGHQKRSQMVVKISHEVAKWFLAVCDDSTQIVTVGGRAIRL